MRIGPRDEHAAILKEDGLGVVETSDGCVGHDGHAVVDRPTGVVEDGIEIGLRAGAETGTAMLAPLRMRYVPSGRAVMQEITRFEGYIRVREC